MEDMVFRKNIGDYFAGAIQQYVEESNFSCIECSMTGNIAESRSAGIEFDSGEVALDSTTVERANCYFANNVMWNPGAIIYATSGDGNVILKQTGDKVSVLNVVTIRRWL